MECSCIHAHNGISCLSEERHKGRFGVVADFRAENVRGICVVVSFVAVEAEELVVILRHLLFARLARQVVGFLGALDYAGDPHAEALHLIEGTLSCLVDLLVVLGPRHHFCDGAEIVLDFSLLVALGCGTLTLRKEL